jgi:hypothetical protein
MRIKPGLKLLGSSCVTEVVVVRGSGEFEIACCGQPMTDHALTGGTVVTPGSQPSIQLGKRYVDETAGIEVLCTKPGPGPLSVGGREMQASVPRPLPASD